MQVGDPISEEIIIRARESFARQGLMAHLGAAITEVRAGIVKLRLPFRQELTQQHGYFHAGGTSAIADSAGGYAGFTLFPEGSSVLTVEFKLNLISPAQGDYLEAVGRV
ncbi:MAG: PaaI family thioesterase, partial [Rhodobacteraceae bacterium]|nr:PaaI family thioesterase [Paracoccaceae bacterium]